MTAFQQQLIFSNWQHKDRRINKKFILITEHYIAHFKRKTGEMPQADFRAKNLRRIKIILLR